MEMGPIEKSEILPDKCYAYVLKGHITRADVSDRLF